MTVALITYRGENVREVLLGQLPKIRVDKDKDGKDVYQLLVVDAAGAKSREYYSVETGLKLREESEQETPQGPMTIAATYGDYKAFGGVLFLTNLFRLLFPPPQILFLPSLCFYLAASRASILQP